MKKLLVIALLFTACHKEELQQKETTPNYIVFGHYYGECMSHCVLIYKMTPTHLYEDQHHQYPGSTSAYAGNYTLLSDSLFEKVKLLTTKIPKELLSNNQRVIGQPDATDGGGIYFEISIDGKIQFWLIDKMKANLPAYLPNFVDEIERNIGLISN